MKKQYRLRNIPTDVYETLKSEQKKMNDKSGRYHPLEKVIYKLIRSH